MTDLARDKKTYGLLETAKTVLYAVLIALVVRTFAYEPFNIPSGSMKPTLLVGDYLFVSKFSYGYSRYSLPFGLPLIPGRIFFTPPKRGDVVVFKLPTDNKTDYIKRIIGLPGDRIQMKQGRLYINDQEIERDPVGAELIENSLGGRQKVIRYTEVLPEGKRHPIYEISDSMPLDNTGVYEVPPGHYFCMGDNRDSSQDSRVSDEVGFVPAKNLVGRAEFLFFSTDGSAAWWEVWKWPFAARFSRFFHGIN